MGTKFHSHECCLKASDQLAILLSLLLTCFRWWRTRGGAAGPWSTGGEPCAYVLSCLPSRMWLRSCTGQRWTSLRRCWSRSQVGGGDEVVVGQRAECGAPGDLC
jgi:hypothetical protein